VATVEDLLHLLSRPGALVAADVRAALGVSPATLSRLVSAAGSEVVRFGRARAVRYARTRVVEGVGRSAEVYRVGSDGEARAAGGLTFLLGGGTLLQEAATGRVFTGLPPVLADMAPQGYLGHGFSERFPELDLPPRVSDWSDDHRLRAIALRGEDAVGDLVVGAESLARFLRWTPREVTAADYPALAQGSARDASGSSAGGERPKFGAFSEGRHVLVKFAPPGDSPAARRWRDLLWCEWRALTLMAEAGVTAAEARWLDVEGWRFLETVRFDRVGARGRRAVLTLGAIDNEEFGRLDNWTAAAGRLIPAPFSLPAADASRLRWLDAFGQLIGNTDRHFWNVTFFVEPSGALRLAPSYDMLPMILAPSAETLVERRFEPAPPHGSALVEWKEAVPWALRYWRELEGEERLERAVRLQAREAAAAIDRLAERIAPGGAPGR
jgi:hypothetical protein